MKSRSYCFTINNWTEDDWAKAQSLKASCKYLVIGKEVGDEGTPHLQGFAQFHHQIRFTTLTKQLPRAHIEPARGRPDQAATYCKKEGDFWEAGEPPVSPKRKGELEKERWASAWKNAKAGKLEEIDADIRIRCYRTLKEVAKDHMVKPEPVANLEGEWHVGPSGCGKSRGLRERYPDAYYKMCNKWWDGYQGEETVIVEDFDKSHAVLGHHLKLWGDHGAFLAETKGGALAIRPRRVLVTSNWQIEEIWEDRETVEPLMRRYAVKQYK